MTDGTIRDTLESWGCSEGIHAFRGPTFLLPPSLTDLAITHPGGSLGLQLQVQLLEPCHLLQHKAQVFQVTQTLPWKAGPGSRLHITHLWEHVKVGRHSESAKTPILGSQACLHQQNGTQQASQGRYTWLASPVPS